MANGMLASDTKLTPDMVVQARFQSDLSSVMGEIFEMLAEKNRKYGDAALNPSKTFSKASAIDLINARMDDKLSRIRNRQDDENEDAEKDLLGYLILKQIAKKRLKEDTNGTTTVSSPSSAD